MIDLDRQQRWVDAVDGDLVAVTKEQVAAWFAEIRDGRRAKRDLARQIAFGDLCQGVRS